MKKLETFKPKLVEKRWGSELWTANDSVHDYCGKILHIKDFKTTITQISQNYIKTNIGLSVSEMTVAVYGRATNID